ncbi:MAG: DUF2863 family protein [Candidatus Accumulibacter sp.]|nr:DUF2863 family protein [Candidatus Accumulibacter propinquus]
MEEYRVGFGPHDSEMIYHGVVWPLLASKTKPAMSPPKSKPRSSSPASKEVVVLDQQFPYEFCDDCGAPLCPISKAIRYCRDAGAEQRPVANAALNQAR